MINKQTGKNMGTNYNFANITNYSHLSQKLKFKYFLDKLFAYPLLFSLSPLVLLAAWIIKLDGWINPDNAGKVFYTEQRISEDKIFRIIKFRTVPKKTIQWLYQKPESRSITGSKTKTDAGKLILRWYLDEIPQLFNIIKGEMSFVGPRPHIADQYNQELKHGLLYRKKIKAGFFGVPQACKRHPKYKALLEHMARTHKSENKILNTLDGLYAKRCLKYSIFGVLLFDFTIMARCIIVILRGGAKY